MSEAAPKPIPIPLRQRWHDIRVHFFPLLIFVGIVFLLVMLWKNYASAQTLVGQAEVVPARKSCYKPGMLAKLTVNRFDKVKAGDEIGEVMLTDPKILASSLAVIQAEIEQIRISQTPIANEQRLAMEYSEVRLHWMAQRAELGAAKADLLVAQADYRRTQDLFKDKIVSERAFDLAKAKADSLQNKVEELATSVEDQGKRVELLQPTNALTIARVSDDPLRALIAVEESKLKLTEAELNPITLRASVDGMIDVIYHRVGEAITAGEPIIGISPASAARIIGYLRPPLLEEPKVGGRVEVRTRGPHRQTAQGKITDIGTQFETLPAALQMPVKLATAELGLPLSISVPSELHIRPGELVDLTLASQQAEAR